MGNNGPAFCLGPNALETLDVCGGDDVRIYKRGEDPQLTIVKKEDDPFICTN